MELESLKKNMESERRRKEQESQKGEDLHKDVHAKNIIIKSLEKKLQEQIRDQHEEILQKNKELADVHKSVGERD